MTLASCAAVALVVGAVAEVIDIQRPWLASLAALCGGALGLIALPSGVARQPIQAAPPPPPLTRVGSIPTVDQTQPQPAYQPLRNAPLSERSNAPADEVACPKCGLYPDPPPSVTARATPIERRGPLIAETLAP